MLELFTPVLYPCGLAKLDFNLTKDLTNYYFSLANYCGIIEKL